MAIYNKIVICILASILIIISIIYAIKLRSDYLYGRDKANYLGINLERSDSIKEDKKVSLERNLKSNIRANIAIYVFGTFMAIAGILFGCFINYVILK